MSSDFFSTNFTELKKRSHIFRASNIDQNKKKKV